MKANFCLRDSVFILHIIYFSLLKFIKINERELMGMKANKTKKMEEKGNYKIWEARNSQTR